MNAPNIYAGIGSIVKISAGLNTRCKHCEERIDGEKIDKAVNHYIHEHKYRLLHVGTETSNGQDGKPWHDTVALVGI